ncbi:Gamma-interferon-inducible lysosomal thiol reductase [Pelomyxa schiedti]|nr:Gamma-interferon-inducible lysosomal thiol reductase [Pelomyxa schiedti]
MRFDVVVCIVALVGCVAGQDLVSVILEVEAMCPNCQDFISSQLNTTLEAEGVWDIMDLVVIPWGNAYCDTTTCPNPIGNRYDVDTRECWNAACVNDTAPSDCFTCIAVDTTGQICQHGNDECIGNRYEGCAIYLYPDSHQWEPFVYCYEGLHGGDTKYLQTCSTYASLDYNKLYACATSSTGVNIDIGNAKHTNNLGPHPGVPYTLINGVEFSGVSLLRAVCAAYTGVPPAGCP